MASLRGQIRGSLHESTRRNVAAAFAGLALLVFLFASAVAPVGARDFRCTACDVKDSEVARCLRMDPEAYSTALFFNPPGKKTLFERSSCLQGLAVEYIDPALCAEVRERKSLFFDGSAISREACLAQVREKEPTRKVVVIRDLYRPEQVGWFRNGNSRDVDVRIWFAGSYRHRYEVDVSMLDATGTRREVLHRDEYRLGPHTRALYVRVTQDRIAAAADALGLAAPYRFRLTVALVDPTLAEVEQFAAMSPGEREHGIERVLDPATLGREPRDPPWRLPAQGRPATGTQGMVEPQATPIERRHANPVSHLPCAGRCSGPGKCDRSAPQAGRAPRNADETARPANRRASRSNRSIPRATAEALRAKVWGLRARVRGLLGGVAGRDPPYGSAGGRRGRKGPE